MNLNFLKKLFAAPITTPGDTEREVLENNMMNLMRDTTDRVIKGGKWNLSQERTTAEFEQLKHLFDEVLQGRATFSALEDACRRWEEIGTGRKQPEKW